LAFATFLVWRLRIGACGVGACGFWRLWQLPENPTTKFALLSEFPFALTALIVRSSLHELSPLEKQKLLDTVYMAVKIIVVLALRQATFACSAATTLLRKWP